MLSLNEIMHSVAWILLLIVSIPFAILMLIGCVFGLGIALWVGMAALNGFVEWFMRPIGQTYVDKGNGELAPVKVRGTTAVTYNPKPPVPLPPLKLDVAEMTPAPFEFEKASES